MTIEQITDLVNQTVNGTFSRRLGDFKTEIIRAVETHLVEHEGAPKAPTGDGKGKPDSRDLRIEALEKENLESKEAATKSRLAVGFDEALAAVGITAMSKDHKAGILMRVSESDGKLFVGHDPIETFARDFARSDEGRRLIPAKGGSGTGSVPGEGAAGMGAGGDEPSLKEVMQGLVDSVGTV